MNDLTLKQIEMVKAECKEFTKDSMDEVSKLFIEMPDSRALKTKTDLYRVIRIALLSKGIDDCALARDLTICGMLYHLEQ